MSNIGNKVSRLSQGTQDRQDKRKANVIEQGFVEATALKVEKPVKAKPKATKKKKTAKKGKK